MSEYKTGIVFAVVLGILLVALLGGASYYLLPPEGTPYSTATPTLTPLPLPTSTPSVTSSPTYSPIPSPILTPMPTQSEPPIATPTPTVMPTPIPTMPTPIPTPTPQPISLYVVSQRSYYDQSGEFWIFGEVRNNGTRNLTGVTINVEYYDGNNALIWVAPADTMCKYVMPGENSPFSVMVRNSTPIDHYELQIVGLTETDEQPYREAEILSYSSTINPNGELELVGEVRNTGNKTIKYFMIAVAFYDGESRIVAAGWTYSEEGETPPGGQRGFKLTMPYRDLAPLIDNYLFTIEGNPTE